MIFIANWKMNFSFADSVSFVTKYKDNFAQLCTPSKKIVLCPSFPALYSLSELCKNTALQIGAQDCSPHPDGAYTGQVSAQSLKQVGCTYCIIGHSEQRAHIHEDNETIAQKMAQLFLHNITPILCIGESLDAYRAKKTFEILESQLRPALSLGQHCIIAYEPMWAIGTGIAADPAYLTTVFQWFADLAIPNARVIYGGSVNEKNIQELAQIPGIDGFLIGNASLDFQKMKKIVSLG